MKNCLFSMLALTVVCLWVGNSANAQRIYNVNYSNNKQKFENFKIFEEQTFGNIRRIRTNKKTLASEDLINVTLELKYNPDIFLPIYGAAYNSDITAEVGYKGNNKIDMSIPKGVYDFMCDFSMTLDNTSVIAHCVRELVDVVKDTTVVLDAGEISRRVSVKSYSPTGELCYVPKYDEESNVIIDEGTVDNMHISSFYLLKGYGYVSGITGGFSSDFGDEDGASEYDFYVNELSDRYILAQSRISEENGMYYVNKFVTEGTEKKVLSNNPNDFCLYEAKYDFSPLGEKMDEHFTALDLINMYNYKELTNVSLKNTKRLSSENMIKIFIDAPKEIESVNDKFDIMVYPKISDYTYSRIREFSYGDVVYRDTVFTDLYNIGLPMFIDKMGIEYVNNGHAAYGNYAFQIPAPEEGKDIEMFEYPGHPSFSYTDSKIKMGYGNSSPINAFMARNLFDDAYNWNVSYLSPCYIGRLGEIRMSDLYVLKMSLKYNGEEVLGNFNQLDSLMTAWAEEKHPYGEIDLTLTNENVDVDGISGYNLTRIIYDQRKEDWTAPTLQMLHFKNTDGMITDRFDVPQDGILEFCGGDFNLQNKNDLFYFDCKEQAVAVAYSPYGQDSWTELAVDEIPELYRMPGFGYFYRGSLESVNRESSNGWYDLKITLTDASGNMQEQTISPAFRIGNVTGVSETLQSTMSLRHVGRQLYVDGVDSAGVSVYTADGMCVVKAADAVTRPVSLGNVAPGMYVVRATAADGRQIVRKITVH